MWNEIDQALEKSYIFNDFIEAFAFMTKVAMVSESLNHHPTLTNTYNKVTIRLSTHDQGNIVTDIDRRLAIRIDELSYNH